MILESNMPICTACHNITTKFRLIKGRYYEKWYHNNTDNETLCQVCYSRLVTTPRFAQRMRKRIICYGGKQIALSFEIRKYICSECGTNDSTKKYDIHHDFYIPIIPWLFTRELCFNCHLKQGWNDNIYTHNQYNEYQVIRNPN